MTHEINEVLKALVENKMMIHDDHNGSEYEAQMILLQIFKNGNSRICLGFKKSYTPYFSVNPLYVDKETGKVHLNRASSGGVVDYANVDNEEEGIKKYNKEHEKEFGMHDKLTIINLK